MKQKIIVTYNIDVLNKKIEEALSLGWFAVGSHSVVTLYTQCSYRGDMLIKTTFTNEYSQTVQKI